MQRLAKPILFLAAFAICAGPLLAQTPTPSKRTLTAPKWAIDLHGGEFVWLFSVEGNMAKPVITLAESSADAFYKWHESFVINGHNDPSNQKTGKLEFLSPDLKTTLLTIEFSGLGISEVAPDKSEAGRQRAGPPREGGDDDREREVHSRRVAGALSDQSAVIEGPASVARETDAQRRAALRRRAAGRPAGPRLDADAQGLKDCARVLGHACPVR
jgi:hypothetical protein